MLSCEAWVMRNATSEMAGASTVEIFRYRRFADVEAQFAQFTMDALECAGHPRADWLGASGG